MKFVHFVLPALILVSTGCGSDDTVAPPSGDWFVPAQGMTFDWQLDEVTSSNSFDAQVVDVDGFDISAETVAHFQSQGIKMIAYVSVGTVEEWRSDVNDFPAEIVGNAYDGWEGEKWLDINNIAVLGPIIEKRLDMIKAKGFDGIEPDNIDGFEYEGDPGFNLTEAGTKAFCEWLIEEAHERGLSIGQKNASGLAPDLVMKFDWMLTEDAFVDDWFEEAEVYLNNGKAVFVTEYDDVMTEEIFMSTVCTQANSKNFSAILKDRDLVAGKTTCN